MVPGMITAIMALFKRTPVTSIMQDKLYEAQRGLIEHQAAAEHHTALASMYRLRVMRLQASQTEKRGGTQL